MALRELILIQTEFLSRPSTRVPIPTIGEKHAADIQEQRVDSRGFCHG
jgi:hypothetical protein